VPITCIGGGSATISVNGGSYTTATTILNGQSFTVRLVASSSYLTPITAFITAGGGTAAVSATCTVWTADAPAVPMRIALTGNTTYYVNSTTGNDSNIGTSTAPWLTLTHANSYISNNIDLVGYTVTINYNGSVYSTVTSNTPSITYGFGTTPTAPVALNVGERATITFSSASTIPLNIATATGGGIYRMNMVVTANNTSDSNWLLKPNNTTYAVSSFSSSGLEVGDGAVTAFGSATTLNTYTKLTTSPYVGNIAQSWTQVGGATTSIAFFFDLFAGPGTSDHVNGIGASISEFLVSTYTVAKMLKHSGGIMGGSSLSFSIWNDTTTAWTSLGTLVDMNGTSLSGTIIVERLA
jgi:hypothetical protein